MDIILHQFPPGLGLPNPSPFCMKLEMYLRLAQLEHRIVPIKGRPKSATGKAPHVEIDGKVVTDSGLIIEHLERVCGHRVDGKLTLAQRAESLALQRMMEEHLYWVIVYGRWVDPEAERETAAYIKQLTGIPGVVFPLLLPLMRREIRSTLRGQGLGRHPRDVLYQLGINDVAALGHWLGTRSFGFGDTPTTVDLCLASFVGNIIRQPWPNPLTVATSKYGNLIAHFERVMGLTFPEAK